MSREGEAPRSSSLRDRERAWLGRLPRARHRRRRAPPARAVSTRRRRRPRRVGCLRRAAWSGRAPAPRESSSLPRRAPRGRRPSRVARASVLSPDDGRVPGAELRRGPRPPAHTPGHRRPGSPAARCKPGGRAIALPCPGGRAIPPRATLRGGGRLRSLRRPATRSRASRPAIAVSAGRRRSAALVLATARAV